MSWAWSNRVIGEIQGYKVVDLFPYKISNIDNFLFRDIPPYIPGDNRNLHELREIWRRAVEGLWVDDNGTWVWMMPNAYFYANLATVVADVEGKSKRRTEQYPDLRDNEWIIYSYMAGMDGFSGFSDDHKFTCNRAVLEVEKGKKLPQRQLERLEKTCMHAGKWKTYIPAWEYLTYTYLIAEKPDRPLGTALYDNPAEDGLILGSRKLGKTYTIAGGDAARIFWTNGAREYEDLRDSRMRVNMFAGSSDSNFLGSFMTTMRTSFTNIPGVEQAPHPFFTRTATESWHGDRDPVIQKFRREDGSTGGSLSEINKAIILPNKSEAVVSKRCIRIYVDEVGLQPNIQAIRKASEASQTSDTEKFGSFVMSGTGGNIEKIAQTKALAYNCEQERITWIPNYWHDGKPFPLFMPVSMTLRDFKDRHGNTDLMAATEAILEDRFERSGGDLSKITEVRMNYPLEPREIFLSGKGTHFDRDLLVDRIDVLENLGVLKDRARVFSLELGPTLNTTDGPRYQVVAQEKGPEAWNNVIMEFPYDTKKTGELVVVEPPMPDGREFLEMHNLYKVVYDPKQDTDTGESYASIKVYKGTPTRALQDKELFNTVVAFAKVKEDGHMLFMLLCLWYKARGQYERNVSGIPDFFSKYGLRWILQPTPYQYIKDSISPTTRQAYDSGIVMTAQLKMEGRRLLKQHHRQVVHIDDLGRAYRQTEFWYDIGLLHEMNMYDPEEGNYDDISAMFILMLWLQAEFNPTGVNDPNTTEDAEFAELAAFAESTTRLR